MQVKLVQLEGKNQKKNAWHTGDNDDDENIGQIS